MINKRSLFAYLDALLIVVLLTAFFRSYYYLIFLILLLIIPAVSYFLLRRLRENLTVSVNVTEDFLCQDEEFSVEIKLHNKIAVPSVNADVRVSTSNAFWESTASHTLNMPIKSRDVTTAKYMLKSANCGILRFEIDEIYLSDITGIVRLKMNADITREIVVLPSETQKNEISDGAISAGSNEATEGTTKGADFSEVTGIREYESGDRMADIHWKLSAKRDILMVKERCAMSSQRLILVPELCRASDESLNLIMSEAYGISQRLIEERIPFSIMWWSVLDTDFKTRVCDNKDELVSVFEQIFYEKTYKESDCAALMLERTRPGSGNFLLINGEGETYFKEV